ncbi:VOC family protein [Paludicola sp. MB14-C6]|uniref:VOC family protein n=1 Tax=Paludihabitans sp. MB14-C6 TaxID=3070656 RepID=UPI0027DCD1B1|nr:VOC family protein [Paludicola sp. MB14-C6]WMJ21941.1 VOC family protein [Paludicola sp. MB14-C6]
MHLGSIYLIVKDFNRSIDFYEKLLQMKVTSQNMERFAQFVFEGHNISLMNAYFDQDNPQLTTKKGKYVDQFDNLPLIAESKNTHKFVLNFWTENLEQERERILSLKISNLVTPIKYVNNVMPYYYFQLDDPDGNTIEITGPYNKSI